MLFKVMPSPCPTSPAVLHFFSHLWMPLQIPGLSHHQTSIQSGTPKRYTLVYNLPLYSIVMSTINGTTPGVSIVISTINGTTPDVMI